ncbi:hypothetical protein KC19_4G138700 [Ceratodon purpureus]|uniref:Uncharacterized protein n=1 Tax=Ceratodon purpureus TaxID=3225 RepID=A0A8T0IC21_CERPU|nr:hypothetical protein KC19_4G138700 [Ceratodon purpureus]
MPPNQLQITTNKRTNPEQNPLQNPPPGSKPPKQRPLIQKLRSKDPSQHHHQDVKLLASGKEQHQHQKPTSQPHRMKRIRSEIRFTGRLTNYLGNPSTVRQLTPVSTMSPCINLVVMCAAAQVDGNAIVSYSIASIRQNHLHHINPGFGKSKHVTRPGIGMKAPSLERIIKSS